LADFESERKGGIRDEPVALGMPERDLVYAVWKKDTKLVLKKIRVGVKPVDVQTEDLRGVYERCLEGV
jgi:hypothetical protein